MIAKIDLVDDRKTLLYVDDPANPIRLAADQVDAMLKSVGLLRSAMLPEIPQVWASGTTVAAQRDPKFSVEADMLAGDALLHVRDPHFGWRHFIISKDKARELGEALIAQADAPSPAPAGRA